MKARILMIVLMAGIGLSLGAVERPTAKELLGQDTWRFSAGQLAILNEAPSGEIAPLIYGAIRAAGLELSPIKISESQWICMNPNGPTQLIVRIEENPRGVARGLYILAKIAGRYSVSTVDDAAPIHFYKANGQAILVAYREIMLLSEADPQVRYPLLYAWEDGALKEVSRKYPAFYKEEFVPKVHACIEECTGKRGTEGGEGAEPSVIGSVPYEGWRTLELAGMALAIARVNSMFPAPIVSERDVKAVASLLYDAMPTEGQAQVEERQENIRKVCEQALKAMQGNRAPLENP